MKFLSFLTLVLMVSPVLSADRQNKLSVEEQAKLQKQLEEITNKMSQCVRDFEDSAIKNRSDVSPDDRNFMQYICGGVFENAYQQVLNKLNKGKN